MAQSRRSERPAARAGRSLRSCKGTRVPGGTNTRVARNEHERGQGSLRRSGIRRLASRSLRGVQVTSLAAINPRAASRASLRPLRRAGGLITEGAAPLHRGGRPSWTHSGVWDMRRVVFDRPGKRDDAGRLPGGLGAKPPTPAAAIHFRFLVRFSASPQPRRPRAALWPPRLSGRRAPSTPLRGCPQATSRGRSEIRTCRARPLVFRSGGVAQSAFGPAFRGPPEARPAPGPRRSRRHPTAPLVPDPPPSRAWRRRTGIVLGQSTAIPSADTTWARSTGFPATWDRPEPALRTLQEQHLGLLICRAQR